METKVLENLVKSRRSIRKWLDKPVPEELLLKAVELATYAPNGGNQQNWRFYIIVNKNVIQKIGEAVQTTANLMASWPETEKLGYVSRVRDNASFFKSAPALVVVGASRYQSVADQILEAREKVDTRAKEIRDWRNSANSKIQSVASAIAYMLLILQQMGLGAVWMTGPMQAKGEIEKIIKIQKGFDAVAIIPVGYPAEDPKPRERKPFKEVGEVIR